MLIFDEQNNPILIDSIYNPILTNHMWVLDLTIMDFTLSPLIMLEETICSSVQLTINGFSFILPSNWNILVFDQETFQLDIIELSETTGKEFTALLSGPNTGKHLSGNILITDYFIEHKNVGPSLNKHQMLCHPISATEFVCISPANSYNKYLKDTTVGDIL